MLSIVHIIFNIKSIMKGYYLKIFLKCLIIKVILNQMSFNLANFTFPGKFVSLWYNYCFWRPKSESLKNKIADINAFCNSSVIFLHNNYAKEILSFHGRVRLMKENQLDQLSCFTELWKE